MNLTLQDAIATLHEYWKGRGCLIWQPTNTEVGAGTMNVATYLRVLGPEPWHAAYVEPSVRPDDSRYGENPNRVQMHTQYQVILKPDPGNPQEMYLESLEALGIDTQHHDVRFVEDNWESPALGAWGLGWEVWLDGLEITQFTYFQQAGGFQLDPVSVEITYGLDRILMCLQSVDHFKKLIYAPGITYGELFGRNEYEMSVYNLDSANIPRMRQLFELYEAEAHMLLAQHLPLAAYTYVLKTSQVFNLLDARGAVGVTERAQFFNRIRGLARQVAKLWLDLRNEVGFPLKFISTSTSLTESASLASADNGSNQKFSRDMHNRRTFLLELGSEEMPPDDVNTVTEQVRRLVAETLASLRLDHERISVEATPRRIAVVVDKVKPRQRQEAKQVRGPRFTAAYDVQGRPTRALTSFAQSNGVTVEMLEQRTISDIEYLVATVQLPALDAGDVLSKALPGMISRITFPKGMRWNASNVVYSRPLRWFVALLGDEVLPFTFAGITSGRQSRDLRNAAVPMFDVPCAEEYNALIAARHILLNNMERRQKISTECNMLAAEVGGRIPASAAELLDEVIHLVEAPIAIRGQFSEDFLKLPCEVLVTVMRKHQRYFPVEDDNGMLLPYFIAVANGHVDASAVRAGNEAVLRARYADAEFYWRQDTSRKFEDFRAALHTMTFQQQLGSMLDKSQRLEQLVPPFADLLGLSDEERATAQRAAFLAKADLTTQVVTEFTSLAGLIGSQYALRSGEHRQVAQAILDHALPRAVGGEMPSSRPGMLLAIADRLDSLVGLFAVGLAPKSSADPFALRRAAMGVLQILVGSNMTLDLKDAIKLVARLTPVPVSAEVQQQVLQFIIRRFEQWLQDAGERGDLVQAVLAARGNRPALAKETLTELVEAFSNETFKRFLTAYSRPARIVQGRDNIDHIGVNPSAFVVEEERNLWNATQRARGQINANSSLCELLQTFEPLVPLIEAFFTNVFVMVDDLKVRHNRLALLRHVSDLSDGILDLTIIEGF